MSVEPLQDIPLELVISSSFKPRFQFNFSSFSSSSSCDLTFRRVISYLLSSTLGSDIPSLDLPFLFFFYIFLLITFFSVSVFLFISFSISEFFLSFCLHLIFFLEILLFIFAVTGFREMLFLLTF